jgi:pimeloyl-ACP methyl ester carboxylesterase
MSSIRSWPCAALVCLAGCVQFQQQPRELRNPKHYVALGKEHIYIEEHGPTTVQSAKEPPPAIALVHGFGATGRSWLFIRPALAQGHRVLVMDAPGFGRSDKYAGDYSIRSVADKLIEVLERRGADRFHLVCHSWGTAVCLAMALRQPGRVQSLTLISSFAYQEQLPPFLTWSRVPVLGELLFGLMWDSRLDDRLNYSFYDPDRHIYPAAVDEARKLLAMPGALAASLAVARGMDFDWMVPRYHTIARPALIISGQEDAVTRLPAARRLYNDLPRARHLVIPQCGHVPFVEHPAKVAQAVLAFLHEQEAQR